MSAKSVLLAACLLASGCVTMDWEKEAIHRPVPEASAEALRAEGADFGTCLERLGAPLEVFELGEGLAVAYGWLRIDEWGVEAEVPLGEFSGSVSYAEVDRKMRGLLLQFDDDLQLVDLRWGWLDDLTREKGRVRPLDPDELAGA